MKDLLMYHPNFKGNIFSESVAHATFFTPVSIVLFTKKWRTRYQPINGIYRLHYTFYSCWLRDKSVVFLSCTLYWHELIQKSPRIWTVKPRIWIFFNYLFVFLLTLSDSLSWRWWFRWYIHFFEFIKSKIQIFKFFI